MTEKVKKCYYTIIELIILTIFVIIATNVFAHILWIEQKVDLISNNIIWKQLTK